MGAAVVARVRGARILDRRALCPPGDPARRHGGGAAVRNPAHRARAGRPIPAMASGAANAWLLVDVSDSMREGRQAAESAMPGSAGPRAAGAAHGRDRLWRKRHGGTAAVGGRRAFFPAIRSGWRRYGRQWRAAIGARAAARGRRGPRRADQRWAIRPDGWPARAFARARRAHRRLQNGKQPAARRAGHARGCARARVSGAILPRHRGNGVQRRWARYARTLRGPRSRCHARGYAAPRHEYLCV